MKIERFPKPFSSEEPEMGEETASVEVADLDADLEELEAALKRMDQSGEIKADSYRYFQKELAISEKIKDNDQRDREKIRVLEKYKRLLTGQEFPG